MNRLAHKVAIALGSNIGDSRATLKLALEALDQTAELEVLRHSSLYQTVAIGPPQPDVINACAILATPLSPQALLDLLLQTEARFGRVRQERWGPRSLDLDLLLFENQIIDQPGLQIPHPRMHERGFVLVPLAEIAPDWIHPVLGLAIATLLQTVDCTGVKKLAEAG